MGVPRRDTRRVTEHSEGDCQGRAQAGGMPDREPPGLNGGKRPAGQREEEGQRPRRHGGEWAETMRRGSRDPGGQQLGDLILDSILGAVKTHAGRWGWGRPIGNGSTVYSFVKDRSGARGEGVDGEAPMGVGLWER